MRQKWSNALEVKHIIQTSCWAVILHTLSLSVSVVCAANRLSSSAILAASNEPSLLETASKDWGGESVKSLVIQWYIWHKMSHEHDIYPSLSSSQQLLSLSLHLVDFCRLWLDLILQSLQFLQKYRKYMNLLSEMKETLFDWSSEFESGDDPYLWPRLQTQQRTVPRKFSPITFINIFFHFSKPVSLGRFWLWPTHNKEKYKYTLFLFSMIFLIYSYSTVL